MGAEILHEPRRGYGRACLTGVAAVNAPDVVVFLDGDYSDRPAEMPRLLEPPGEGTADIVIGSRLAGERMAGWGLAAFDHVPQSTHRSRRIDLQVHQTEVDPIIATAIGRS